MNSGSSNSSTAGGSSYNSSNDNPNMNRAVRSDRN
jgi:hypothetical protein